MKLIISFYAGGSGNFLADFLLTNSKSRNPSFRIDEPIPTVYNSRQIFLSAGKSEQDRRIIDNVTLEKIEKKFKEILAANPDQILTHYPNVSKLKSLAPECKIIKIYPVTNIFGMIKNVHFKKQEAEYTSYQYVDDLSIKIDHVFLNILNHYTKIKEDQDLNYILDFGKIYDINYLSSLYLEHNGFTPDEYKINFANEYINAQFLPLHDTELTNMQDIIKHVNPKDYFDVAVCLFIFEKNNRTIDKNRLWTINDMPNSIEDALEFILVNSKRYSFSV